MVGRILVLLAALLVAAIGAALVLLYVREADRRAVAAAEGVEILVASVEIPAGTPLTQALTDSLRPVKVPPSAQLPLAVPATFDDVTADQLIINDLQVNEQLQTSDIGDRVLSDPLDLADSGDNLVQFVIDDPRRVSGFAEDGSSVSVYVTLPASETRPSCTQMVAQSVEIAVIGTQVSGTVDPATGVAVADESTNVTFKLDRGSDLGQRLIQADVEGDFSLVLIGGDGPPPAIPTGGGGGKCLTTEQVLEYEAEPMPAPSQ